MIGDLSDLATTLAERINRPVAIDDPTMRLLTHTPHHGPVDPVRMQSILHLRAQQEPVQWVLARLADVEDDWVRIPAQARWELLSRVCAPLRHQGRLYGYLWVTDPDESLTEADLEQIVHGARAAARNLAEQGVPRNASAVWERSLVEDLVGPEAGPRRMAAQSLASLCSIDGPVSVVALGVGRDGELGADSLYLALGRITPSFPDHRLLSLVAESHTFVVIPAVTARDVTPQVAALARAELARSLGRDVASGAGGQVPSLLETRTSYTQAVAALQAAQRTTRFGAHAAWADLGVARTLLSVPDDVPLAELVPPPLWQLMHDPAAEDLLHTVEVYLDHAGDVQASVADLHVHRTSLYYRLKRFTEVSGFDLQQGYDRLSVHAALTLARLRGWSTPGDRP